MGYPHLRFRFAVLPDGLYIAEFGSPNDLLPRGAIKQEGYSMYLHNSRGLLDTEPKEEMNPDDLIFVVTGCATYDDAVMALEDYVRGNGGFLMMSLTDSTGRAFQV